MAKEKLPLKTLTGIPFRINIDILKEIEEELELFLLEEDFMNTRDFSRKVMFNQEIKANNTVEGYNDSVSFIKKVIENASEEQNIEKRNRIINLYNGYQYILKGQDITEENKNFNKENQINNVVENTAKEKIMIAKDYNQYKKEVLDLYNDYVTTFESFGKKVDESVSKTADKIEHEVFNLMVLGEAKSGKSTFINAYLGEEILPMDELQCTSSIIEIKRGDKFELKAQKASGDEIIITEFNEITEFLQTHAAIPDEYRNIPVSTINNMLIEYLSKNNKIDDKDIDDFLHREEVKNANTFKLDDRKYKDSIRKYIEENSVKWKEIITDIEITCQLPEYMQGITIIDSPGVWAGGNVGRITEDYKENADAIIFIKSLVAGALESDSFTKLINNEITKKQKDFLFLVFTGKCRGLSDAGFKELRPKAIEMYKSRIDERKILFVDSKIHLFLNKCLELRTKEKIDKFFNEENNKFAEAKLCWLESEKDFRKFEDNMAEKSDFRSVKIAIEKFAQKTNYLQLKALLENLKKSYFEYKDIFSKSLKIAEENKNDPIELENKINRKLEEINDTLKKMNDGIRDIGKEYIGKGENYGKIKNEIEIEKRNIKKDYLILKNLMK